jgi:Protein of unknown function (DUF2975)
MPRDPLECCCLDCLGIGRRIVRVREQGHRGRTLRAPSSCRPDRPVDTGLSDGAYDHPDRSRHRWLIVVFIWRLFGHYLRGDIFSAAAVAEMGRAGWTGVAAVVADLLSRPLVAYALTPHLGEGARHHFWIMPNDLLHLLLALFIVALAEIFRAGVEIADDNRQIV